MNSPDNITVSVAKNLAQSLRSHMIILSWIIFSCVVIVSRGIDARTIILGLIFFIAMYGIVVLQNDLSDSETDKLNKRYDIPYSQGHLSQKQLTYTILLLSIIVSFTGFILSYHILPWAGLYILLGYLYSGPANVKSRGAAAALLLGFCYGAMPWLIGASITGQLYEPGLLTMSLISFIFSSGIIVIKDFKDIAGDKATNKNTLLVMKGATYTRRYYLLMTSAAYVAIVIYCQLNNNLLLAICGTGLSGLNYWLLASKEILQSSHARSSRGKWSRVLFFSYALAVYLIDVLF